MNKFVKMLFGEEPASRSRPPHTGLTEPVYAVGDIHGRADLLDLMVERLHGDMALNGHAQARWIFLGDYIDRGPDSRGVLELLSKLSPPNITISLLKGNHEEALEDFLLEPHRGPAWIDWGGAQTMESYGVHAPANRRDPDAWRETARDLASAIPPSHKNLLRRLKLNEQIGDYFFVHAGVDPDRGLHEQDAQTQLWIREPFLSGEEPLEAMIVHGHTPTEKPVHTPRRIGVDTGAFASGQLTAVCLEESKVRFLQATI